MRNGKTHINQSSNPLHLEAGSMMTEEAGVKSHLPPTLGTIFAYPAQKLNVFFFFVARDLEK